MHLRLLLVRHASTEGAASRLIGRARGVALSDGGVREAAGLSSALAGWPLEAVYASPQDRTRQTAEMLAEPHGIRVRVSPSLDEIDFGRWTGRTFEELERDPRWRDYNARRARATIPSGEAPTMVWQRAADALADLRRRHDRGVVVAVTHAEIVRCAVLQGLERSLDEWATVRIDPASATAFLAVGAGHWALAAVNVHAEELPRHAAAGAGATSRED